MQPEKPVMPLVAWVYGLISHFEMHDDEFLGRWLLRTFGTKLFPNIRNAVLVLVDSGMRLIKGFTGAQWFTKGYPCLGTGGGPLDEHELPPAERMLETAATRAAKMMGISEYPPIAAMLAHAVRVDRTPTATSFDISAITKAMHRSGVPIVKMCRIYDRIADAWFTVLSGKIRNEAWQKCPTFNQLAAEWIVNHLAPEDFDRTRTFATAYEAAEAVGFASLRTLRPLLSYTIEEEIRALRGSATNDNLFELSGIVDALNMDNAEPGETRQIVFTALDAKWAEQLRFLEGYDELNALKKSGKLYVPNCRGLKIIGVVSDNPEINRACRHIAPRTDVFVQRNADGHLVIWYNQAKLNMDNVVARLRMRDRVMHQMPRLPWDDALTAEGTLPEAPWWYYNPASGQIMCGSRTNRGTPVTKLGNNAVLDCIVRGATVIRKHSKPAPAPSQEVCEEREDESVPSATE